MSYFQCILSGENAKPPEVRPGETLFVDRWGGWDLYKNGYLCLSDITEEYIKRRKYDNNVFNINYLRKIESK